MADENANKDTIRQMFAEVVNQGRIDLVDELFDPEFQTVTPQGTFDRDGFKGFVQMWRAAFDDVNCEVYDLVAEGDRVAWAVRATGTHTGELMGIPATGKKVDFDSFNIAEMRGGRGYRHRVLMDTATLLSQLGAGPAAG